jgi:hypothetical protein
VDSRLQIVAIVLTAALLVFVLELVRRRRVMERYALLWLLSATVLLVLAVWSGLLEKVASAVGIATPTNALFAIAFGFVLVLLLHFSTVISGLTDQNKLLAQRLALVQQRLEALQQRLEGEPEPAPPLEAADGERAPELSRQP